MSSSDRRFVLAALLALPACGFTPVHAPGGSGERLRDQIRFNHPAEREGYEFVKRLEERLGRTSAGRFALTYEIETRVEGVGVTSQQEITRYQIFGTVTFTLTESGSADVTTGAVESFTAYSAVSAAEKTSGGQRVTTVASEAAERDAYRRLMVALADLLVARLYAVAPGA